MIISLLITCPPKKVSTNSVLVTAPQKKLRLNRCSYFTLQKSIDYSLLVTIPHKK